MGNELSRSPSNPRTESSSRSRSRSWWSTKSGNQPTTPNGPGSGSAESCSANMGFSNDADEANLMWMDGRMYQNVRGSTYFLPRDEEELERINTQHFVLKTLFGGNYLSPVRKVLEGNGKKILDIGCGPGTWLLEMALEFPNTSCVGIDVADVFPNMKPPNAEFMIANVLDKLSFEDETFDFVNMRSLMLALRKNEWPDVLAELYRVTKKGGLVQLTEMDIQFTTTDEFAKSFLERVSFVLAGRGQDPVVATHLHNMLMDSGYDCIMRERKDVPIGWNGTLGDAMFEDTRSTYIAAAPLFSTVFAMTRDEYIDHIEQVMKGLKNSEAQLKWYSALGRKPEEEEEQEEEQEEQ